ncbi:MAG: ribose 5-phosphate isomerase B [Bacteroidota bacterium]
MEAKTNKIAIACDHAGFQLKEQVKMYLNNMGYEVEDFGTNSEASVDYPDFVHPLANFIEQNQQLKGILICGSGIGVSISANRHKLVRAALCWNEEVAKLSRMHNNANVICLPARFISKGEAEKMIDTFLNTSFEGGRHENRVGKIEIK